MPTRTSAWLVALLAAGLAAATLASSASAAVQRYASPAGSGTACSAAAPCAVQQAIDGASAGDEVIVAAGDYHLTSTLYDSPPITIHGAAGQPRPRLLFSGAGQAGMVLYHGTTLRYLEIQQAAQQTALFALSGAKLDQVIVRGLTDYFCTVEVNNGTMRNSIVVAPGSSGSVVCTRAINQSSAISLRNVTAVATGSLGVAIDAFVAGNGQSANVNLVNVIAKGGPGGAGLVSETNNDGSTATITASHTNFANYWTAGSQASYVDGGGNQGTPPSLISPATGDYRQAPWSVTVGAGLDAPDNGASDFEGDPRAIGTTDIGADEFVPAPAATTGLAGSITSKSAKLSGSVNPHGAPTTYRFEYGRTSAYGTTTSTTGAGSGMGAVAAGASLAGLSPATTYHFRVVATNAGGVAKGSDKTFTTSPPAPATPPSTQTPPATPTTAPPTASDPTPAFAGVTLLSRRLSVRRRHVTLVLRCPAGTVGRCSGRTLLTARARASSQTAAGVVLGRATFSITAGEQAKVRVRVSRTGLRLLRATRRLRARDTNAARDQAGQAKTTVTRVTIRRGHR